MEPPLVTGPDGTVVVGAQIDPVRPHGFMVRADGESVILEVLGEPDPELVQHVLTRLVFTPDGLRQFILGLATVLRL